MLFDVVINNKRDPHRWGHLEIVDAEADKKLPEPELLGRERGAGAQSLRDAVADLARRGYVATPA